LYPKGDDDPCADYISLYLRINGEDLPENDLASYYHFLKFYYKPKQQTICEISKYTNPSIENATSWTVGTDEESSDSEGISEFIPMPYEECKEKNDDISENIQIENDKNLCENLNIDATTESPTII